MALQEIQVDGPTSQSGQSMLDPSYEEDTMQGLIRHMVCMILQPFAEHVRVLQTQMQHAQKDMHLMDERVNENKASLEQHDRDILGLRATSGQLSARLDKTQLELTKENEEKTRLDHELEATKVALSKNNERQQSLKMYVDGVQQQVEELESGVNTLKSNTAKFEKNYRGHMKNFTQLREAHDELIGRYSDSNSGLDEFKQQYQTMERDLQRFMKNHKKQTEEDTQILGSLNAHVTSVQALLEDTRESLQKTIGDVRSTNGDVQMIRDTLEHVNGQLKAMEELQRSHQESNHNLRKTMDLLNKTDNTLEKLGDAFVEEKQRSGSLMQDLKSKVDTHSESISGLNKLQHRQGDLLKDTVWRTDKLQRDAKRLQEQEDGTEAELQNLAAFHKATTNKLELHVQEQTKMQMDMQQMGKDMDNNLLQMKGDLGNTGVNLAKLGARFEACNSNLQGVGKGLQDVHRHIVAGENGLLAPKSARNNMSMLPALSARGPKPPTREKAWTAGELGGRPGTRGRPDE